MEGWENLHQTLANYCSATADFCNGRSAHKKKALRMHHACVTAIVRFTSLAVLSPSTYFPGSLTTSTGTPR